MNWLTFRVSRHAPAIEAERMDEEIVSRRNVLVSQNRNDSLEIRHDVFQFIVRLTSALSRGVHGRDGADGSSAGLAGVSFE